MKYYTLCILLICSFFASAQLDKIETEELSLVSYNYGHKYVLPHAGRCFHSSLQFHKNLFDYTPDGKISLLIQDFGDYGNAGATAVPLNSISMGLSPFSYAFETSPAGEKVFSMMNHELVHVVALDNATATDMAFRKLFLGKVQPAPSDPISMFYSYLTTPRRYSPRWYHEGIAAYLETWMSGGLGLALGSYDEMVFRTRVLEDAHIYSAQGLESEGVTTDFQGRTNSYLYGTRFMGYLAYTYGPDKIIDWVKRNKGSKAFFVSQFKNVFDKKITVAWDEWIEFERKWQQSNIDELRKYPITKMTPIRNDALGSVAYAHFDKKRNKIYTAVNNPGKVPHLTSMDIETGKMNPLTDIKGAALFYVSSVTYDAEGDMLYFTSDNEKYRDLNSYNLKTKETKLLQKDFRTGDLSFNKADKSIWGIKHLNGFSTIVRIPFLDARDENPTVHNTWEQMYTLPYGQDIFDIDVSPDGKLLSAAVADLQGNQILILYQIEDLQKGQYAGDTLFNFDVASPQSFRFSDDGKYLLGSSYYTGVSNIFQVEVENKKIIVLSNSETGLFRPTYIDDNKIFAFNFKSDGFQPVFIPKEQVTDLANISFLGNITIEKHPMLADWQLPIPSAEDVNLEELIIEEGKYNAAKEITVKFGYPILVGYKNNFGVGYKMNIADPFNFRTLDFSISYTPREWVNSLIADREEDFVTLDDEELVHFDFEFKAGKFKLNGGFNQAEFHDLFGPSQGSRKGARLGLSYEQTAIYDPPRILSYSVGITGFYGLDQSPEYQQILVSGYNKNLFVNLSASISYSASKGSLGAVDAEKGFQGSVFASTAYSAEKIYPRVIASLNYGIQLPGKHFSLWIRTAGGSSFSNTYTPFTRFGFGAFGNNYIDYSSTRQYRSPFSFPGVSYTSEIDKPLIAQRFGKATAEFVIPPLRFKKLGGFNFFANWIQPTVFSSILYYSDVDFSVETTYEKFVNVGSQIDLRMVTFSLLPSTLSFGYARAWNLDGLESYDEWMISLKLLH